MVVIPIRLLAATIIRAALRGFPLDGVSVFRIDGSVEVLKKQNHVKFVESIEVINPVGMMIPMMGYQRSEKIE